MKLDSYTTSAIRKWQQCRRRYKLEYLECYKPPTGGAQLLGIAIHAGLQQHLLGHNWIASVAHAEQVMQSAPVVDHYACAKATAMLASYCDHWGKQAPQFGVLAVEKEFLFDWNGIEVAGKIDAIVRVGDRVYVLEHKTTSEDVSSAGSSYWQRLALDLQLTIYSEAVRRKYGELPGVIWDVLRKPLLRPIHKRITRRPDEDDYSLAERKAASLESAGAYQDRCKNAIDQDRDAWFVRRSVHRLADQHDALLAEAFETIADMSMYDGTYPRNDGACTSQFGQCPYLGVCTGIESLDSDKFTLATGPHTELSNRDDNDCPL